jgi:FlaG/FlaF family flagellin (archaellin)
MATTRLIAVALAALFIGVALGYTLSIAAPYQLPTSIVKPAISLSKSTVAAGEQYTATLTGFPANTEIIGWTVNENPPKTFSAGTTDANGKLVLTGNAPETPGNWPLVACDKDQSNWITTTLQVI